MKKDHLRLIILLTLMSIFFLSLYENIKHELPSEAVIKAEAKPTSATIVEFVELSDGSGALRPTSNKVPFPNENLRDLTWPKDQFVTVAMQIVYKDIDSEELYNYVEKAINQNSAKLFEITGHRYMYIPEPKVISMCDNYGFFKKADIIIYYNMYSNSVHHCRQTYKNARIIENGESFSSAYKVGDIFIEHETYRKNASCDFSRINFKDNASEKDNQKAVDDFIFECLIAVAGNERLD